MVALLSTGADAALAPGRPASPGAAPAKGTPAVIVGHDYKRDKSPRLRNIAPVSLDKGTDTEDNPATGLRHTDQADPSRPTQPGRAEHALDDSQYRWYFDHRWLRFLLSAGHERRGRSDTVRPDRERGLQVFNKSTGASVMGPVAIDTLWSGFGGPARPAAMATRSCCTTSWPIAGSSANLRIRVQARGYGRVHRRLDHE